MSRDSKGFKALELLGKNNGEGEPTPVLEVGKQWRAEDGSRTLTIEEQEGDWFTVTLRGPQNEVLEKITKEKGNIDAFLKKGGYSCLPPVDASVIKPVEIVDGAKSQVTKEGQVTGDNKTKIKAPQRIETQQKDAIDKQIASMELRLKKLQEQISLPRFKNKATPGQKAEHEKLMEELKRGIEKAKQRKAEQETVTNKGVKWGQVNRPTLAEQKRVIDEQIAFMEGQLKNTQVDQDATPEQIAKHKNSIKALKLGIVELIDKQIDLIQLQLQNTRVAKNATPERIAKHKQLIEKRKLLIEEAKQKKAELELADQEEVVPTPVAGVPIGRGEPQSKIIRQRQTGAKTGKEKPIMNGHGTRIDLGSLPEEQREYALRREARKNIKIPTDRLPVVPVAGVPTEQVKDEEAKQLELPIEIPYGWPARDHQEPGDKQKATEGVTAEQPKEKEEVIDEKKMEDLRKRVDEARTNYAKEDYENTSKWVKLKNIFRGIKQGKSADSEYFQAQYNNALIDLHNAELAQVKQSQLQGNELHEALAGTLMYFKYDELVNVANERTRVRVENQGWPGKVLGVAEGIVRSYNKLSFGKKLRTAGVMWGLALGLAGVTGGASLLARRMFAGVGAAVAYEGIMEKVSDKRSRSKAEKESAQKVEEWERRYSQNTEVSLSEQEIEQREKDRERHLNKVFEEAIFSLDEKLQKKKRDALYRKTIALGAGLGSSYLATWAFHHFGGDELVKGVKESIMHGLGGGATVEQVQEHLGSAVPSSPDAVLPDSVEAPSVLQNAVEMKTNLVNEFVNRDIVVEKGDSVWKISGKLADQLNLEGAQRTHFIDALKDQFGDLPLGEGQHINFSDHGIDENFVDQALERSGALTPEQSAQILVNDTRLSAFAEANRDLKRSFPPPTEGLRFEGADVIDTPSATTTAPGFHFGAQADLDFQPAAEQGVGPNVVAESAAPPEFEAFNLDERVDGWYKQVFEVGTKDVQFGQVELAKSGIESLKLRDLAHDAKLFGEGATEGYYTGLKREQISNFARFFQGASSKEIGFDATTFLRENPNANLTDYFEKVAPLTKFGQHIGHYSTR